MAFGAVIAGVSAAAAVAGAVQQANAADDANSNSRAALAAQQANATEMISRGDRQMEVEQDVRNYTVAYNRESDQRFLDQRDWERNISTQNYQSQQELSNYMRQRQSYLDTRAQDLQNIELDAFRRSQGLAQSERDTALGFLRQNQGIAQDERSFSVADQERMRAQRLEERGFQIEELRRAQAIAQREQDISIVDRNRLIDGASDMRTRVEGQLQSLGQMAPAQRFTDEDIQREGDIRAQEYRRAVDRAATMASSQNEAALIANGIDASTTGAARRSEVAERLAPMYQEAYTRARNDATAYISGRQNVALTGQQGEIARRNAIMGELVNAIGAPLQIEARLPSLISAQGPSASQAVGSAVYNQQLSSAGQYSAPIGVGTAMVDPRLSSGVGQSLGMNPPQQNGSTASGVNGNFQRLAYTEPSTFYGQGGNQQAAAASNSLSFANAQNLLAASSASGAGKAVENFSQRAPGAYNAFSNWLNGGSNLGSAASWSGGNFAQGTG